MFGVIIGLIGVLCLLLYFGMTAVEVLIKYSILALRFIFWFIPLWIKAAAIFFYGWGWVLYYLTVNKQILRQIRESEKLKSAYDYQQKQAWQRQQDEFRLLIPVEKYPYANRELFGKLAVCIHKKEYDKLPVLENEIKESHFNNIHHPEILNANENRKLYEYEDIKDLLPFEQNKTFRITCDIREINGIFVVLAQSEWTGAKKLWHTNVFYQAMEALPLAKEYITLYEDKKIESVWLDMDELNQSIEKLKEEAKLYTYDDVKDITPIRVRKRYGVTSDVRRINDRYVIVVETDDGKDRILFQMKDHNDAMCALSQMVGFITGRSGKFDTARWLYVDRSTKKAVLDPPRE